MNILITGICGLRNKGVEALLRTVIRGIKQRIPEARFTVPTYTPEYDLDVLRQIKQVEFVRDPYLQTGSWSQHTQAIPRLRSRIRRRLNQMLRWGKSSSCHLKKSETLLPYDVPDLVIVSGGDLYCSDYGHVNLSHFLEPIHWAHSLGVPCVLLAQSVGIFKNDTDLELWKQTAKKITLITVREPLSRDYLVNETGVNPSKIIITADTAFLLDTDRIAADCVRRSGSLPTVAVSISQGICDWSGVGHDLHISAWVSLIRRILDDWGCRVLIVPHVHETYCDDRIVSTKVWRALGFDSRVMLAGADHTALEYKGMISECEMVIAERMHASLAGFSSCVPTVPIGYSIKARGITAQLFDETSISADSVVISSEDFVKNDKCHIHMDAVWNRRKAIADVLKSRLPVMESMAMRNFELLDQFK
jgi:colanic acid/amylovoran biosynthesis protein